KGRACRFARAQRARAGPHSSESSTSSQALCQALNALIKQESPVIGGAAAIAMCTNVMLFVAASRSSWCPSHRGSGCTEDGDKTMQDADESGGSPGTSALRQIDPMTAFGR